MNEISGYGDISSWDEPKNIETPQNKCMKAIAKNSLYWQTMAYCGTIKKYELLAKKINKIDTAEEKKEVCSTEKKDPHSMTKESQKGNVYSIITGLAIIGIGISVGWACPPAGALVVGLGSSLVTNAVCDEISTACEPKKEKEKPPQEATKYPVPQAEYDPSEYGVEV